MKYAYLSAENKVSVVLLPNCHREEPFRATWRSEKEEELSAREAAQPAGQRFALARATLTSFGVWRGAKVFQKRARRPRKGATVKRVSVGTAGGGVGGCLILFNRLASKLEYRLLPVRRSA